MLVALHTQAAIMDEENEVGPFPIAPLESLEIGLMRRWICDVAIQIQLHCHSTCLEENKYQWDLAIRWARELTKPMNVHVLCVTNI